MKNYGLLNIYTNMTFGAKAFDIVLATENIYTDSQITLV